MVFCAHEKYWRLCCSVSWESSSQSSEPVPKKRRLYDCPQTQMRRFRTTIACKSCCFSLQIWMWDWWPWLSAAVVGGSRWCLSNSGRTVCLPQLFHVNDGFQCLGILPTSDGPRFHQRMLINLCVLITDWGKLETDNLWTGVVTELVLEAFSS